LVIRLIIPLTIKQAKAKKITRLSGHGKMSNAAAINNKIPAPVKTALHTQVFLVAIYPPHFEHCPIRAKNVTGSY